MVNVTWLAFFTAKAQKLEPLPPEAQVSKLDCNVPQQGFFDNRFHLGCLRGWEETCWIAALVGPDWVIMNTQRFLSWPHPFLQFTFRPSPFPPFLFLYSQICPTPFFSMPLALCTFFHSTQPPLPPITHAIYAPPTLLASWGAKLHSLLTIENIQSHQPHTHDPLCLCTHTSCVCLPPSLCPPPLPPLTSPPSLQLSSSLPELTLSLAFALTGQSPRAERPHLLFDLPLSPALLSLASSLQRLTHSSAVQPSG